MNKTLGERIEKLLKQSKLTQKELAAKIGVTEAAVSRYIKDNRDPKIDVIANMATALHTTTDYLLGREESDCIDTQFGKVRMFVVRNASEMTTQQKQELIEALLNGKKGLEFVKNVLLPEEKQKDQRTEELEKEKDELKEQLINLKKDHDKSFMDLVNLQMVELREARNETIELKDKLSKAVNHYNELQYVLDEFDLGGYPEEVKKKLEQLKGAVVPKFKVGDEVYIIRKFARDIVKTRIAQSWTGRLDGLLRFRTGFINGNNVTRKETELFATEQEARKALEELKNGKD